MRSFLLRTSILERSMSIWPASSPVTEPATALPALAQANALIQPLGGGWYRYHPLLAEVLRLKLQRESPDLEPDLHRRAAQWLREEPDARRGGPAGRSGRRLAACRSDSRLMSWRWTSSSSHMASSRSPRYCSACRRPGLERTATVARSTAALGLASASDDSAVRRSRSPTACSTRFRLMRRSRPGSPGPVISLRLAHRTGDLGAAKLAAADAAALAARIPADQLTLHPDVTAQVMAGRGAVELWSGHFDQAATSFRAAAAIARNTWQRADCLGHLALLEALCGRLSHAAELAVEAAGVHGPATPRQMSVPAGRRSSPWPTFTSNATSCRKPAAGYGMPMKRCSFARTS